MKRKIVLLVLSLFLFVGTMPETIKGQSPYFETILGSYILKNLVWKNAPSPIKVLIVGDAKMVQLMYRMTDPNKFKVKFYRHHKKMDVTMFDAIFIKKGDPREASIKNKIKGLPIVVIGAGRSRSHIEFRTVNSRLRFFINKLPPGTKGTKSLINQSLK